MLRLNHGASAQRRRNRTDVAAVGLPTVLYIRGQNSVYSFFVLFDNDKRQCYVLYFQNFPYVILTL